MTTQEIRKEIEKKELEIKKLKEELHQKELDSRYFYCTIETYIDGQLYGTRKLSGSKRRLEKFKEFYTDRANELIRHGYKPLIKFIDNRTNKVVTIIKGSRD